MVTATCSPSRCTVVAGGIQSLRRSRLARMNSTAASTDRSALVASKHDRVDEGEQHRPVRAVEPFHQRQVVVAVVGRHRLVRGGQLLKSAGVLQGLEHQPPGPFRHLDVRARARNFSHVLGGAGTSIPTGVGVGGRGRLARRGQHGAEHPQQPLGLGPVLLAQLLQPIPALLMR